MKKFALITIFSLLIICAYAQEISDDFMSESKAVRLTETKGSLLKKETFTSKSFVGLLGNFEISAAMITDIRSGEKEPYVIVKSLGTPSYSSIIDFDELPACIEALNYMIEHEINTTPPYEVDISIITRDGLAIGVSSEIFGKTFRWQTFLTHGKYISNPSAFISINKIQDVLNAFLDAKTLLEDKIK